MKETQYLKIKELHASGGWVCNNAYREKFIFSPHKRREEMVKMNMCAGFEWHPCEHGFANVRDYKLILVSEVKINNSFSEISREPRQEILL